MYEGIGSVRLGLSRVKGAYREVSISWQAIPDSASAADFQPLSGEVFFKDGQRQATVDINIVDDPLPEYHEVYTGILQIIRQMLQNGSIVINICLY